MTTPDISKFQRTGDPQADLARWEAMGGTKEQLQAAFGDPVKPNSTFTAGQQFPPMPPNGNIWGGQMPMMMPPMGMMGGIPPMFSPQVLDFSTNSSTSSTSSSSSATKKTNIAKDYGIDDSQKTHMQEDNYQTYITKAENTQLTKQERKAIKKKTKDYSKEIGRLYENAAKEFKAERKESIRAAKKAGKSKDEISAIEDEYGRKIWDKVKADFEAKYPNEDYYAVEYNISEIYSPKNVGLFGGTPQLIYTTKD